MTDGGRPTVRKFNPGTLQSDREIRYQFVVRRYELRMALETLRDNLGSPSCQHIVVVGRRGMGKTMLLARVAAEIRGTPELAEKLLPVRFTEENHEILDIGDFWCEALFHLASQSAEVAPDISRELREVHGILAARRRGEELAQQACAAVLEAADRLGRQLVVMVENFQTLAREGPSGDDFGWKLRQALQTEPKIIFLGTATDRSFGQDEYEAPFYGMFRVLHLEPLGAEDCAELWRALTAGSSSGRNIRPLQILTGGNPRLLAIVAQFGARRSLRELMEQLVALVDDHTEYFRSHLEGLARTERRVYVAAIDLWQASSSQEIADRARMDIRTVSALLGRLMERGLLLAEKDGKKRRYAPAERLFCIYYKLRRERDDAAIVRQLIRFMAAFYAEEELAGFARTMLGDASREPAVAKWLGWAMQEPMFAEVASKVLFDELRQAVTDDQPERIEAVTKQVFSLEEKTGVPDDLLAPAYVAKGHVFFQRDDPAAAEKACRECLERFGASGDDRVLVCVAGAIEMRGEALSRLGRNDEALECFEEVERRFGERIEGPFVSTVLQARLDRGLLLSRLGRLDEAARDADRVIERTGREDLPTWRRQFTEASFLKAAALRNREGADNSSLAEAVALCDRVVERLRGDADARSPIRIRDALLLKSDLLAFGGRPAEALAALERVDAMAPDERDDRGWGDARLADAVRADALFQLGRRPEAEAAVRRLYAAFDPDLPEAELSKAIARLVGDCIRFGAAGAGPGALVGILEEDPEDFREETRREHRRKMDAVAPLLVALRQMAGLPARAPAEALEVAKDLRNEFDRERKRRAGFRSAYELPDEEPAARVAEPKADYSP